MEFKVGDKLVFGRGKKNKQAVADGYNIKIGVVYEVTECCGKPAINDNEHLAEYGNVTKATKIVEA